MLKQFDTVVLIEFQNTPIKTTKRLPVHRQTISKGNDNPESEGFYIALTISYNDIDLIAVSNFHQVPIIMYLPLSISCNPSLIEFLLFQLYSNYFMYVNDYKISTL